MATTSDQKQKNQWGFLKNIVNIDSFFSSGSKSKDDESSKKEKSSLATKTTNKAAQNAQKAMTMASSTKKAKTLADANAAVDSAFQDMSVDKVENSFSKQSPMSAVEQKKVDEAEMDADFDEGAESYKKSMVEKEFTPEVE